MSLFARVSVPVVLVAGLAASSAQAFCMFDGCQDINIGRSYHLNSHYYVEEPSNASMLSDTQTYSVYLSGEYADASDPVATFQLTNLHQICCTQMGGMVKRSAVRLTMDGQSVDLCAYKPDFVTYRANLAVTGNQSDMTVSLSYPAASGTCDAVGGEFIPGSTLTDITSVQLSKEIS